jgi:hypothetical protein
MRGAMNIRYLDEIAIGEIAPTGSGFKNYTIILENGVRGDTPHRNGRG